MTGKHTVALPYVLLIPHHLCLLICSKDLASKEEVINLLVCTISDQLAVTKFGEEMTNMLSIPTMTKAFNQG